MTHEPKVAWKAHRASRYPALIPLLEWVLANGKGMSLHNAGSLENQLQYLDDRDVDVYFVHNMDRPTDSPSEGRGILALAAIKDHDEYVYEAAPYKFDVKTEGQRSLTALNNVSELCCLVVMPDSRGQHFARMLTEHRLSEIQEDWHTVIELRPSEGSFRNLGVEPEAHECTASVRAMAEQNGFKHVGRAPDNSVVLLREKK